MSSTYERLRRLQALRSRRASTGPAETSMPELPATDRAATRAPIKALEAGEIVENSAGSCYLVTRRFTTFEQRETSTRSGRGQAAPGDLLQCDPSILAPLYPGYGLDRCPDFHTSAFLDIESTGLGGGAGIYAFMVGVGTFEQEEGAADGSAEHPEFVVRQFFMRHPGEEPALLTALTHLLRGCRSLVTFNGRSFDAPLLRGRYRYSGRFLPTGVQMPSVLDSSAPHLDLLHPARRLWRKRLGSCSLSNLERAILGRTRTEDDVPGSLIPQLYADYLRDGDGSQMQRVFYHNREDIVSMAVLAEVIYGAFSEPTTTDSGALQSLDLLNMARLQMELERLDRAETLFRVALEQLNGRAPLAETFDGLGRLLKRQRRWDEAVAVWQQWLTTVRGPGEAPDSRPYVELAKYYEWQSGDLAQAAMWTQWALHEQEQTPVLGRSPQTQAELRHRLARIQRKLDANG